AGAHARLRPFQNHKPMRLLRTTRALHCNADSRFDRKIPGWSGRRGFHICAGRNCPGGLWATDHKNTHHAYSQLSLMGVLPLRYDERIKGRRQFAGFLAAEGITALRHGLFREPTVRLVADTKSRSV